MSQLIELKQHGAIAEVALNRPDAYNAFVLRYLKNIADINQQI